MSTNLISDLDWPADVGAPDSEFDWSLDVLGCLPNSCVRIDGGCEDAYRVDPGSSRKRERDDACGGPKSKACREKMRREKLNDRFLELGSIIEPGRSPKFDKALVLSDATRLLVQLRNEAQQLKESNEKLQETIKDLKTQKNMLRDEKAELKAEKERLERLMKTTSWPSAAFMPHLSGLHSAAAAAFPTKSQVAGSKMAAYPGFPGVAMWQWMPPAVVDTSQDHKLRPPVA